MPTNRRQGCRRSNFMDERDFFNEKQETKRASFVCPNCRERSDYDVTFTGGTCAAQERSADKSAL